MDFPLDRLALSVLGHLVATEEWNTHNFLLSVKQRLQDEPAERACAEAMGWLVSRGLVIRGKPGQSSSDSIFVSRSGARAVEHGLSEVNAAERIDVDLLPELERVRSQFLLGEFELAAFAAMREVEIAVRAAASAEESLLGVKLMRSAFGERGPLRKAELDGGEQTGLMELFSGAIATFKNPPSHRQVNYSNPTEASEVILLADLLLRILGRHRVAGQQ